MRTVLKYPGSKWNNVAGYLIDKRREDLFSNYNEHFVNRYVITLTKQIRSDVYSKASKILYKDSNEKGQDYYSWEDCEKEIEQFRGNTSELLSYLSSKIKITPLDNDACTQFLHSTISTQGGDRKAPLTPQFFDAFLPDCNYEGGTTMKIGDYFCPIISIKLYPNSTFSNQLSALTKCNVEHRWVTRYIGIDKDKVRSELEKYQKRYYGSQKSWKTAMTEVAMDIESTRTDPAASAFQLDAESAIEEFSTDTCSFGYYTATLMCWDLDLEVALQKAHYLIGLINKSGFGAILDRNNNFAAWLGMMPGNVVENVRRPIMSTANVAQIIPLSSMWQGNRNNVYTERMCGVSVPLITCGTRSGTPFFYNQNHFDIGHGIVLGPTGAGKSTFLALLESQFLKYPNANVIIFDKDKSARAITMAAGGIYMEPGSGDCTFQPLHDLETQVDMTWAAEFIELLLTEQKIEVNTSMRKAINITLKQLKAQKRPELRDITSFQQYCSYSDPETKENTIANALEPYTASGQFGSIFDSQKTNINLSKWLMIEMGTLMKMGSQAVTPALMYLFRFIEKIYATSAGLPKDNEMTLIILDEAWVFLDNDYFRKKLEDWLLTLRKFRVFVVFATQEVAKVANSKLATTIISQCQTKVYLADEAAQSDIISHYYESFDLTPDEIATIASGKMKYDYFYKSADGCRQFQLDLDPFQLAILTPDNPLLDSFERKYGKNCMKPLAVEMLQAKGFGKEVDKYLNA